ncbi:holo-ACP synthase [Bacillus massilinigeriensis]|uniref:holo-ACP synthase n=1 Tax=Bacillus mediterraneensis TaxID=1805474 RepID=UPI0008F903D6|nr:holo-ACP synthase [Bacillus mediterraneensis]
MIKGTGIDIVEISRVAELLEKQPKFVSRILTVEERVVFSKLSGARRLEYFAGRFAAKEAYAKAAGTGIGASLSFLDIETGNTQEGRPVILRPQTDSVHLSISHSREYAVAQVIIEA